MILKKVFSSLQNSTSTKATKVVGIDFGSSSVKVVELQLHDDVITLSTYGELQLGPYAETSMGAVAKLTLQKRVEALVDVFRESSISAKDAVFALPLSDSFVTIISLPAQAEEDIAPRVNVEARKYIPVPIADVTLEWSEIPQNAIQAELTREVLLAAIQNQSLADVKELLEAISLNSKPAEIELFSTLRASTKESDTTSVAIIDLGASVSKLYIAEGGFLRRLHRVQFGGAFATNTIAAQLKISFEEAENLKRNYTPNNPHAAVIKKGVENAFERSFLEFKRVITQYEVRTCTSIGRIALTGGSAAFIGAQQYATYALDRQVEMVNPFTKIAFPAFLEDTLTSIAPSFSVALGAALRTFE